MGNLVDFARKELEREGLFDKDSAYEGMLGDAVIDLIKVVEEQNHSGMSISFVVNLFSKLAKFEPISALRGTDDEWIYTHDDKDGKCYQNNRCSHVFKYGNGKCYDIDGKIFIDRDGVNYTSIDSRVEITFPYYPKSEYVKVD